MTRKNFVQNYFGSETNRITQNDNNRGEPYTFVSSFHRIADPWKSELIYTVRQNTCTSNNFISSKFVSESTK